MYDGQLKSSKADQELSWNATNLDLIFDIILLEFHTLLPSVLQYLDLIGQKIINTRYEVIIWTFQSTLVFMYAFM